MQPFRALCFDLDRTLLDGRLFPASIQRTCQRLAAIQPTLDAEQLLAANGEVWRSYWPEMEERWTLGHVDGASLSLEIWRQTLLACGCQEQSFVRLAMRLHMQFGREAHRLFEDVPEALSELQRAHIPLALVTNGASDTQRDKLRVLDLERWFVAIIISGEVGIAKPQAAIFQFALDQLGVEPEYIGHVGDNLVTDVAGAQAVGIASVWLNRLRHSPPTGAPHPDLEIHFLSALRDLAAR